MGRYELAVEHLRQALVLFRQLGDRAGQAGVLVDLGTVHTRLEQPEQATACLREALRLYREVGDRHGEARALNGLGHRTSARHHYQQALRLYIELKSPEADAIRAYVA